MYTITDKTKKTYGRTFHRMTRNGENAGWIEAGASLPKDTTAEIYGDTMIFARAAGRIRGGVFHGGVFLGGEFHGGAFHGGEVHGGVFHGGVFLGGEFLGGEFHGGVFHGGVFLGGEFLGSPCCAQRHDGYMFVAKYVGEELRIWAGCRNFSWDDAVAHWDDNHRHGVESQRIIHFLKSQADAERERDADRKG